MKKLALIVMVVAALFLAAPAQVQAIDLGKIVSINGEVNAGKLFSSSYDVTGGLVTVIVDTKNPQYYLESKVKLSIPVSTNFVIGPFAGYNMLSDKEMAPISSQSKFGLHGGYRGLGSGLYVGMEVFWMNQREYTDAGDIKKSYLGTGISFRF